MPNHVTNELRASGVVLDSLRSDDGPVDFNTVIPMPGCLKDKSPSCQVVDWAKLTMGVTNLGVMKQAADLAGDTGEAFKRGDYAPGLSVLEYSNITRQLLDGPFPKDYDERNWGGFLACLTAIKETGYAYWYDWCCDKWGTKWNAYESSYREGAVRFQTAWSAPLPVIVALGRKFPTETIVLEWADEDFGCNTGMFAARGDEHILVEDKSNTPESNARAKRLVWGDVVPKDYKLGDDGLYHYVGEE